jgi:hypothetical protein
MKYDVTAIAVDPATGDKIAGPRTEQIDTTDRLFLGCISERLVREKYESFWNDKPNLTERIVVLTVEAA